MFVGTLIKACLFLSIHHEQPNCVVLETLLSEWGLNSSLITWPICLHISEGQHLLRLWLKQKTFPEGPLRIILRNPHDKEHINSLCIAQEHLQQDFSRDSQKMLFASLDKHTHTNINQDMSTTPQMTKQ